MKINWYNMVKILMVIIGISFIWGFIGATLRVHILTIVIVGFTIGYAVSALLMGKVWPIFDDC